MNTGPKRYAYHCTDVDPEIIKKEGWKVGEGFTLDNHYADLYEAYLPKVPVFISNPKADLWDTGSKYIIKLDITGLELYPDFGNLENFDAYYDEDNESFYWEEGSNFGNNKKLKAFVREYSDEDTIAAEDFQGEDSFEVIGTACVDGTQLEGRIVEWKENKNARKPEPEQPSPETQRIEASKIEQNNKKLAEMLKGRTILHTSIERYDSEELDFSYPDYKYFTKLDIPPSVKIIDLYWPFCERLTTLIVPGTVKEIRDAWITEADNLKSIVIEEGVEKLTHYCFYNNPALEEITLPDSLKVMQEDCFSACPKLKTVYCSPKIWNKYKKMFPGAVRKDRATVLENAKITLTIGQLKRLIRESLR